MTETVMRSNAEIAGYYDFMGPLFSILFGGSGHMGLWEDGAEITISEAQQRFVDLLIASSGLSAESRLLDAACGNGRPALQAARQTGATVVGINLSGKQIEEANRALGESGLDVAFAVQDPKQMPYDESSFDAVWAVECLSHMADRVAALREMLRVLRPGGRLVLTDATEQVTLSADQRRLLVEGSMLASIVATAKYPELVREAGFADVVAHDLSDKVSPTMTKVLESYPAKRPAIEQAYGEAMAQALADDFPRFAAMQKEYLGYLLITATKPYA